VSASGGSRAVVAALLANLGIALTKFLAFVLTGSAAMLAESIHSVADSGNQVLLMVGGLRAKRIATPQHPFGYGRERYIYAFIVSVVLFTVGGLFALYEGVHKVMHPEAIESWHWVPIVVLVIAIVLEGLSLRTAVGESNRVRSGASIARGSGRVPAGSASLRQRAAEWFNFIRHARDPELPVVLLEDSAALIGLVLALAGVGLTLITGNGLFDGLGTLGIGVLLVLVAGVLAVETKSLLIGESATQRQVLAITEALLDPPAVRRVIHLRTLHLGPEELLVAAKIAIPGTMGGAEVATTIDAAEKRVRAAVPIARLIYLEPDIDRGPAEIDRVVAENDRGSLDAGHGATGVDRVTSGAAREAAGIDRGTSDVDQGV
jgi:cation diffusion facilitator family transporter